MSTLDPRALTDDEVVRYSRQVVLREVGAAGQVRLLEAAVAVVGAGGLGSPALLYLAAAGIGTLTVIDDDRVSVDNLQRQVLHDTPSVGDGKAESARARLAALNPDVQVRVVDRRIDAANAAAMLDGHHVVLDGSDNFATKFAVNDVCVRTGTPAVIGGILRFEGQVLAIPPGAPCYRCFFGAEPGPGAAPTCRSAGVLGPLAGMVGSLMASEAIRLLLGLGEPQEGVLLLLDVLRPRLRAITFPRDPACGAAHPVAVPAH